MPLNDYYPETQLQQPDLLGNYLRGVMAPGAIQGQQQELQMGSMKLDQLRLAMRAQQAYSDMGMSMLQGQQAGAQQMAGRTGGIQNGPQDAVAGTSTAPSMLSYGIDQGGGAAPAPASSYAGGSPGGFTMPSPQTMAGLEYLKMGAGGAGDPIGAMVKAQEYQRNQAQFAWANDTSVQGEAFLREMATSPNAPQILKNNIQSLGPVWAQAAFAAGRDPNDMSAHNVNMVAASLYARKAVPIGMAPVSAPTHWTQQGIGEGGTQQVNLDTGETKPGISRQEPTKVGERWNPETNQTEAVFQQFAPNPGGGAAGGAAGGGAPGRSAGGGGPMTVPVGYKAPTDPELKSAMFASEMNSGLKTVQKLEAQGIKLPPNVRTAMLDAAASDNDGVVHQFMSQEMLSHKFTPEQQTYMQALMPILQAFGHSQAGARVSLSQMRTNMEGVVPIDPSNKEDLQQVMANRHGFYVGALSQANSALQLPQYAGLKGELAKAQAEAQQGTKAPPSALAYLRSHPETASNFKAKYGYLP